MRLLRLATPVLLLLFPVFGSYASNSKGDDVDAILTNVQKATRGITTVHAGIYQEKRFGGIGGSEKYNGDLLFKHTSPSMDRLRVRYYTGSEVTNDLSVIGDDVVFYQPRIKQAIVTKRSKQANKKPEYGFIASPYVSVPQLKAQYNITYLRDESLASGKAAVLDLTPKDLGGSQVKKVVIWVDRNVWLPMQYQVTEKNADVTTYSINNMTTPKIADKEFKIDLPKGTKLINQ